MIENEREYLDMLRQKAGMRSALAHRRSLDYEDLSYATLTSSEWSKPFERAMRNRLIMGAIRYGRIHSPGKKKRDRIASAIHRLRMYCVDANQEHLVDAANECLLEFEEPMYHPKNRLSFAPKDDGYHTPELETENEEG